MDFVRERGWLLPGGVVEDPVLPGFFQSDPFPYHGLSEFVEAQVSAQAFCDFFFRQEAPYKFSARPCREAEILAEIHRLIQFQVGNRFKMPDLASWIPRAARIRGFLRG